jgi:hypothetical protein
MRQRYREQDSQQRNDQQNSKSSNTAFESVMASNWARTEYATQLKHCFVEFEQIAECTLALENLTAQQAKAGRKSSCCAIAVGPRHLKLRYDEPKAKNTFNKFIKDNLVEFACTPRIEAEMKPLWLDGFARTQYIPEFRIIGKRSANEDLRKARTTATAAATKPLPELSKVVSRLFPTTVFQRDGSPPLSLLHPESQLPRKLGLRCPVRSDRRE